MEFLFETTQERKIRKWLRVIAFAKLMSAMIGMYFYFVIQPGIVEENSNWVDVFDFYFNTAAELMIFAGLWHFKPWGWKAAVLLIPISYLFFTYNLLTEYARWLGLLAVPFIGLDTLILKYLFKPEVMRSCNVSSTLFARLKWFVHVLMCLAASFFVCETGMVGLGVVLAILLGLRVSKKYTGRKAIRKT